ncbi:hypothetical protein PseudUWO311_19500 [Pseudanabaena sp. UWO311]|uniref:hypothetical protein n=1 Tax=Pseudanabaena sp. UWO311 TaxID=2487337 RepID=UPI00115A401C|nr:hypothetical protein [Pseudanabaena sp. UWO311]TYQ24358.1 hypothetical protein PseudUWO311_19500 [Pseudanabaena sp. UWO311]
MTITNERNTHNPDFIKYAASIDGLGLANSNAIAPAIHEETDNDQAETESICTVIAIFPSRHEANDAVLEMQKQGLSSPQIVIISTQYQEHQNSMHWEYIASDNGLPSVLTGLGINVLDILQFLEAVNDGKFLVIGLVNDRDASQAQYILKNIGRKVIAVY